MKSQTQFTFKKYGNSREFPVFFIISLEREKLLLNIPEGFIRSLNELPHSKTSFSDIILLNNRSESCMGFFPLSSLTCTDPEKTKKLPKVRVISLDDFSSFLRLGELTHLKATLETIIIEPRTLGDKDVALIKVDRANCNPKLTPQNNSNNIHDIIKMDETNTKNNYIVHSSNFYTLVKIRTVMNALLTPPTLDKKNTKKLLEFTVIKVKERPGKFDAEKAASLGILGKDRGKLISGTPVFSKMLDRLVRSEELVSKAKEGSLLVFVDTCKAFDANESKGILELDSCDSHCLFWEWTLSMLNKESALDLAGKQVKDWPLIYIFFVIRKEEEAKLFEVLRDRTLHFFRNKARKSSESLDDQEAGALLRDSIKFSYNYSFARDRRVSLPFYYASLQERDSFKTKKGCLREEESPRETGVLEEDVRLWKDTDESSTGSETTTPTSPISKGASSGLAKEESLHSTKDGGLTVCLGGPKENDIYTISNTDNGKKNKQNEDDSGPNFLYTLGTSCFLASRTRAQSFLLYSTENYLAPNQPPPASSFVLDCGEGSFFQLKYLFSSSTIFNIFLSMKFIYISHSHADHFLGLFHLIVKNRKALRKRETPLLIICPFFVKRWFLRTCSHFGYAEFVETLNQPEESPSKRPLLNIVETNHKGPFPPLKREGFVSIHMNPVDGSFNLEEGKEPSGDLIPSGRFQFFLFKTPHIPDSCGIIVNISSFKSVFETSSSPEGKGETERREPVKEFLAYTGDTGYTSALRKALARVRSILDTQYKKIKLALVSECTFTNEDQENAKTRKHLTLDQALTLGKDLKANTLYLTHFSLRYKDNEWNDIQKNLDKKKSFKEIRVCNDCELYKF